MIDNYGNNLGRPTIGAPPIANIQSPSLSELQARGGATSAAAMKGAMDVFNNSFQLATNAGKVNREEQRLDLDRQRLELQRIESDQRREVQMALLPFEQQAKSAQIARMAVDLDRANLLNKEAERKSLDDLAYNHGYEDGFRWLNENPGATTIPDDVMSTIRTPAALKGFREGVMQGRVTTAADSTALAAKEYELSTAKALDYAFRMGLTPDEFASDPVKKAAVYREMDDSEIAAAGSGLFSEDGSELPALQSPFVQRVLQSPENYYSLDSANPEQTRRLRPAAKNLIISHLEGEQNRQKFTSQVAVAGARRSSQAPFDHKVREQELKSTRAALTEVNKQINNVVQFNQMPPERREELLRRQGELTDRLYDLGNSPIQQPESNTPAPSGAAQLDNLIGPSTDSQGLPANPSPGDATSSNQLFGERKELPPAQQRQILVELSDIIRQSPRQTAEDYFQKTVDDLEANDYDTTFIREFTGKWIQQLEQRTRPRTR